MASIFGHALIAGSLGQIYSRKLKVWQFWIIGVICTILPDTDVIGFKFGIAYESFWGHRGFSHSFLFAIITGLLCTVFFFRKSFKSYSWLLYTSYFSLCTASHGVLDAMTTGGKGVALLSPFNDARYFFKFRPIQVSPIGIENFFSEWGIRVLLSELVWIGIPSVLFLVIIWGRRKNFTIQSSRVDKIKED